MEERFSVEFPGEGGTLRSCEWGWPGNEPCWVMAVRSDTSPHWDYDGPLDEEGRKALLGRFGLMRMLECLDSDLPVELLKNKAPAEILNFRRGLEQRFPFALKPIEVVSDRVGDHVAAELVAA